MQLAFSDASQAMRMMDLTGTETLKLEEFYFSVQFFCTNVGLKETMVLFKELD